MAKVVVANMKCGESYSAIFYTFALYFFGNFNKFFKLKKVATNFPKRILWNQIFPDRFRFSRNIYTFSNYLVIIFLTTC